MSDKLDQAIAAEEQKAAQPPEPEAIAVLNLVFLDDGSIRVGAQGIKANQCWAAAGTLRVMGDDLWRRQQSAVREAAAAQQGRGRIVDLSGQRIG